jgi:CheY-like chemotaxis protein
MMPDLDGIATLQKLRAHPATQNIPVILLTAQVHSAKLRQFAELGVAATIAKPFNPLSLARQVATALGWS